MRTLIGSFLVSVIISIPLAVLLLKSGGCTPITITYTFALAAAGLGLTTWLILSLLAIPRAVVYLNRLKKKEVEGRVFTGVVTLCLGLIPVVVFLTLMLPGSRGGGVCVRGSSHNFSANSNDVTTVSLEVNSPSFRSLVARAAGVAAWRVRNLGVQFDGEDVSNYVYSKRVNDKVDNVVFAYLSCRSDGHSAAYCHDVLQLLANPCPVTNRFLADISKQEGVIPSKWIRNVVASKSTDGGTYREFLVIEGEIAWSYYVSYRSDGRFQSGSSEKLDAIEFNPAYTNVIKEVVNQVEERMKKEGSYGQFGSCHQFWALKKQLLKEKGINWRSPSELNPSTCYD